MANKVKGKYIEINDAGNGLLDIWSAHRIIDYVGSMSNPFDQDLNTTDDVKFKSINLTEEIPLKFNDGSLLKIKNYNQGMGILTFSVLNTGNYNTSYGYGSMSYVTYGHYNTAYGYSSLQMVNDGSRNTAYGCVALNSLTGGSDNVAGGYGSMRYATIATGNTAYGYLSLRDNVLGLGNTAIGNESMKSVVNKIANTAVGAGSMISADCNYAVAVGSGAGQNNKGDKATIVGYNSGTDNEGEGAIIIGEGAGKNNKKDDVIIIGKGAGENNEGGGVIAIGKEVLKNSIDVNVGFGNFIKSNNTGIGDYSLHHNIQGLENVAIGNYSLYNNKYSWNTSIGFESMKNNVSGFRNVSVGCKSLYSNNNGRGITSIGCESLYSNVDGNNNTAVGLNSLYSNVDGNNNTAVGLNSLEYGNNNNNTAIGNFSLEHLYEEGSDDNTVLGYLSGGLISGGKGNVIIGSESMSERLSSSEFNLDFKNVNYNTSIGYKTMLYNTGNSNVAVGSGALMLNFEGINNTAIGSNSGGGYRNVFTNYSYCVFIGYRAGYDETNDYRLYIDISDTSNPLIYGEFDNRYLKINGDFETSGTAKINNDLTVDNNTKLKGKLDVEGRLEPKNKVLGKKSAITWTIHIDINDGNYAEITGSELRTINNNGWTVGSLITLKFTENTTVYNGSIHSSLPQYYKGLKLAGSTNLSAKLDDTLMLVYDGSHWVETSRSIR